MSDDPKEIVEKALQILQAKKVEKNILKLLAVRSYQIEGGDIVFNEKAELPSSIKENLAVKKLGESFLFGFNEIAIQVIVANLEFSSGPDPDDCDLYGDILIYASNECVLHNIILETPGEWGSEYKLFFSDFSIKKLKLGVWIDQIAHLAQRVSAIESERSLKKKEAELKEAASKIDLGDYDPDK